MIKATFEEIADMVISGELPMDVNMEMEYKGFTIIVDSINGENPYGEPNCGSRGEYKKVCIVPDGEYKWIATVWNIDEAKQFIDRWNS
tara:strand:- start:117 stop:380 length:264 start_codon:yes stop_codon:yes gene_type:complete